MLGLEYYFHNSSQVPDCVLVVFPAGQHVYRFPELKSIHILTQLLSASLVKKPTGQNQKLVYSNLSKTLLTVTSLSYIN